MASKKSSDQEVAVARSVEVSQTATPNAMATASTAVKMKGPDEYPIAAREPGSAAPPDMPAETIDGITYPAIRGEVRTAEAWAEAKGMLPEFIPVAAPFARADAPAQRQHNPSFWRFAATRAGMGWPIGKELTEAEFDAAVFAATTQTYR